MKRWTQKEKQTNGLYLFLTSVNIHKGKLHFYNQALIKNIVFYFHIKKKTKSFEQIIGLSTTKLAT